MNKLLVTDISIVGKVQRSGILKYFNPSEVKFHITDLCFAKANKYINNDMNVAKTMIENGFLSIVPIEAEVMRQGMILHELYKPKFVFQTTSTLAVAQSFNYKIVSENALLCEVAVEIGVKAYNKEWLVTQMVTEIAVMGTTLDIDMVKEII